MGGQEPAPAQVPADGFEAAVIEELQRPHLDGTDHFCLYLASQLKDLEPEVKMETEMELLNVIFRAKYRANH